MKVGDIVKIKSLVGEDWEGKIEKITLAWKGRKTNGRKIEIPFVEQTAIVREIDGTGYASVKVSDLTKEDGVWIEK